MEVELRHLRAFVAVAEERHFGRAATRLGIAQPPLSRQIRDLERELAIELFDRGTRPVRLTDAGAAFLKEARNALEETRRAVQWGRRAGRGQLGRLSIGALPWAYNSIIPPVLRAFRARQPDITLDVKTLIPVDQAVALREERIDIAFAQWIIDARGLHLEPLLEEPMIALVPEGHAWASQPVVPLDDLATEPCVAMCPACVPNLAEEQSALFRNRGLMRNVVKEACGPLEQLALVAAGCGVGMSLGSLSNVRRDGVTFVPLEGDVPTSTFFLLWRRDDDRELLRIFLDTAREVAQTLGTPPVATRTNETRRPRTAAGSSGAVTGMPYACPTSLFTNHRFRSTPP